MTKFQDEPTSIGLCQTIRYSLSPIFLFWLTLSFPLPFCLSASVLSTSVSIPPTLSAPHLSCFSTPILSIFLLSPTQDSVLPDSLCLSFPVIPFLLCTSPSQPLTSQAHPFLSVPLPTTYLPYYLFEGHFICYIY